MLNEVIILKSANENYRKFFSKKGLKIDLYPSMSTQWMRARTHAFPHAHVGVHEAL